MTALKTPDDDAPAAAWGLLAVSIPDWRWMPVESHSTQMKDLWLAVGSPIGDSPSPRHAIDPDHWAWEGWLVRMLGPSTAMTHHPDGTWWVGCITAGGDTIEGTGLTLGRACIAAAAANGRWLGGDS